MTKNYPLFKYIFSAVLPFIVMLSNATAATPDAFLAVKYVQANLQSDFESVVKLTHPEAQQRLLNQAEFFAKLLDLIKRQPVTEQTKFFVGLIKTFYGTDDPRTIRSLDPLALLKRPKQAMSTMSGASDIPIDIVKNAKVSYVGLVQESPSLVHVIVSVTYRFADENLTIQDAIRLKPLGDGWLVDGAASSNLSEYFGDLIRLAAKEKGIVLP